MRFATANFRGSLLIPVHRLQAVLSQMIVLLLSPCCDLPQVVMTSATVRGSYCCAVPFTTNPMGISSPDTETLTLKTQ